MRWILAFLTAASLAAGTALGQAAPRPPARPAQVEVWSVTDDRTTAAPAGISFPNAAGGLAIYQRAEFSRQGEGLDMGLQYRSSDQAVVATIYVYYPSLAHSGLTAFATNEAIRQQSAGTLTGGEARAVAAGGVDGIAIRRDYGGYRGNLASSAAFMRAGRWIVKLRVSGPEPRRGEIMAAMDALLASIRFPAATTPRPALPLDIVECAPGAGRRDAAMLPDSNIAEAAIAPLIGTFDGGGMVARNERGGETILPSRIQPAMCVSSRAHIGRLIVPILRATTPAPAGIEGGTAAIALLNDAGGALEILRLRNPERYVVLRHGIGEILVAATYDSVPSDEQIVAILSGPQGDATRVRARIRQRPGQGDHVEIMMPPTPAAPTT